MSSSSSSTSSVNTGCGGILGFPSLIAGIILLTAGKHWFHGAHTVGLILTIVSGAILLFVFLILAVVVWIATGKY